MNGFLYFVDIPKQGRRCSIRASETGKAWTVITPDLLKAWMDTIGVNESKKPTLNTQKAVRFSNVPKP